MSMLSERLQILITPEQRRRLEEEARRTESSVGALVRAAIDDHYGTAAIEDRLRAVAAIASLSGTYLPPGELEELVDEERLGNGRPA